MGLRGEEVNDAGGEVDLARAVRPIISQTRKPEITPRRILDVSPRRRRTKDSSGRRGGGGVGVGVSVWGATWRTVYRASVVGCTDRSFIGGEGVKRGRDVVHRDKFSHGGTRFVMNALSSVVLPRRRRDAASRRPLNPA